MREPPIGGLLPTRLAKQLCATTASPRVAGAAAAPARLSLGSVGSDGGHACFFQDIWRCRPRQGWAMKVFLERFRRARPASRSRSRHRRRYRLSRSSSDSRNPLPAGTVAAKERQQRPRPWRPRLRFVAAKQQREREHPARAAALYVDDSVPNWEVPDISDLSEVQRRWRKMKRVKGSFGRPGLLTLLLPR